MEPFTVQRPQIEQMIRLIETTQTERIAETERQRVVEEERKRIVEEQRRLDEEKRTAEEQNRRIAEEKRKLEEEARQKALLDEVLKSLQMSTGDAANLAADKESIIEHRDAVDIDD
jgi:trichohyalin